MLDNPYSDLPFGIDVNRTQFRTFMHYVKPGQKNPKKWVVLVGPLDTIMFTAIGPETAEGALYRAMRDFVFRNRIETYARQNHHEVSSIEVRAVQVRSLFITSEQVGQWRVDPLEYVTVPYILCAAIKDDTGKVWSVPRPGRHHDVIRTMRDHGYTGPVSGDGQQGFVLSDGRFCRRAAAASFAKKAGQLIDGKMKAAQLTTEDLW